MKVKNVYLFREHRCILWQHRPALPAEEPVDRIECVQQLTLQVRKEAGVRGPECGCRMMPTAQAAHTCRLASVASKLMCSCNAINVNFARQENSEQKIKLPPSAVPGLLCFRGRRWDGGKITFSLAANDAPIVTQPSALVIISGVHDTCIARDISASSRTRHARSDLLDEALEINIKQTVDFRVIVVVSSASFDAQNIVPAYIVDILATCSSGIQYAATHNRTCQDVTQKHSGKGRGVPYSAPKWQCVDLAPVQTV